MTLANRITVLRILLIPFFVVEMIYYTNEGNQWHRLAALIIFAVASLSDGLDGYVARKYHQRSELGAVLDPLADKLLLMCSVILLGRDSGGLFVQLPLWFVVGVISRDVILTIGLGLIYVTVGKPKVTPQISGKIATALQMGTVVWVLLRWPAQWLQPWLILVAILTAFSGMIYVMDGLRQMSAHPSSAPRE